jgi:hypothetical protein
MPAQPRQVERGAPPLNVPAGRLVAVSLEQHKFSAIGQIRIDVEGFAAWFGA